MASCNMIECEPFSFQSQPKLIERNVIGILAKFTKSFLTFGHCTILLEICIL